MIYQAIVLYRSRRMVKQASVAATENRYSFMGLAFFYVSVVKWPKTAACKAVCPKGRAFESHR